MLLMLTMLLSSVSQAHTTDYDHGMNLDAEKVVIMRNGKMIKLSVYHQSGSNLDNYDPNYMVESFQIYSNLYGEEHKLPSQDSSCRSDKVAVYYVKNSYLNSHDTLKYYSLPKLTGDNRYLGFYSYKDYKNVIMLSDSDYDKLSIGKRYIHEIAHLWYAKNCNFVATEENENEALEIERLVR